jgi:c(7)-type cytochrome triheme protein
METTMTRKWMSLAAVAGALFASAVLAKDLPNLPHALNLPQSKDSPGQVTFNHESHVDSAKPACLGCHPRLFGILGRSSERPMTLTHAAMEKGEACGACHGKTAFKFDDDCNACHAK